MNNPLAHQPVKERTGVAEVALSGGGVLLLQYFAEGETQPGAILAVADVGCLAGLDAFDG